MKKRFGVFNRNTQKYIEFFEYPIQAENYIKNRFNGSNAFKIIDLKRRK